MRKYLFAALMTVAAICMTGCKSEVTIDEGALIGRWEAPSQVKGAKEGDKLVFVFQSKPCTMEDYTMGGNWGYQFDEGADVQESDVLAHEAKHDDQSWFGYTIGKGEINIFSSSAFGRYEGYTQTNTVTAFSSTEMTMVDAGKTYTFKKVVK